MKKRGITDSDTVSASEAARILGYSDTHMQVMCRRGRIEGAVKSPPAARRPRGEWRIPKSSLRSIAASFGPPRTISASHRAGSAGKVLTVLSMLARNPGGLSSGEIEDALEKRFGGRPTAKSVSTYVRVLKDEGFEVAIRRGKGEIRYTLLSSPFRLA